jgi:AraC-like DNA-binding protein
MTKAAPVSYTEGDEYLGIRFKLGTFMPYLPPRNLLDGAALVPQATRKTFWLGDSHWQLPDYENVETFVARLVRSGMLVRDPIVGAVLQDRATDMSLRSVRRRFLLATGLTQSTIRQIERARHASALLQQGVSILDTVYQAGYADQPHMTRSLKRFIGQTPAQIVRVSNP